MWWIFIKNRVEGPLTKEQVYSRIKLNILRSLDKISNDKQNWVYVKDTEFWPSLTNKTNDLGKHKDTNVLINNTFDFKIKPEYNQNNIDSNSADIQKETKETKKTKKYLLISFILLFIAIFIGLYFVLIDNNEQKNDQPKHITFSNVKDKLVIIKNLEASGSGFLMEFDNKIYLVSNEHVLRSSTLPIAELIDGTKLELGQFFVASDGRDIARFEVLNYNSSGFELMEEIPEINDQIVVYGNSLGEGVVTELKGKILGVGPDVIEIDSEIVPGNSGSPIISDNGEVLGVASYLDLSGLSNNLNIKGTKFENNVRRFGVRLRNIEWENVNWQAYEKQVVEKLKFDNYLEMIIPFICFALNEYEISEKIALNGYNVKHLEHQKFPYDKMLLELSSNYKTIVYLTNEIKYVVECVNNNELAEEIELEYENQLKTLVKKLNNKKIEFLNNQKEALSIGNLFINEYKCDIPQILYGYKCGKNYGDSSITNSKIFINKCYDIINEKIIELNELESTRKK